jgi:ABC-type oligopeptide transport system substrate-binding subunit
MKMRLSFAALTMALALSATALAAPAKHKTKWSAEHKAAVKKCNEDYHAALKDDKSKKGKERKEADAAARKTRKQCIADAPK